MSEQASPTPGPWQASGVEAGDTSVETASRNPVADILIPAGMDFYGGDREKAKAEMWANACLIAASPLLLAACEQVLACLSSHSACRPEVEAAIAVARGQAQ